MAVNLTANYSSLDSLREDFSDIITIIDPTETPVQANISTVAVDNPELYEWQLDSLAAESETGFEDGAPFSDGTTAATTPARLKAVCQIQRKHISISNRLNQTDKAGRDSEISYQLALRGEELKRDCEAVITRPRTPVASASGTPPLTAGIPSWIRTNTVFDPDGQDPGLSNGQPSAADAGTGAGQIDATTPVALTEANFLTVVGEIYDEGGNPDMVSLGRAVKQKWSQYMLSGNARSATQYQDQGKSPSQGVQVVGAVDYYVSDFGVLSIVPNRFQRERDVMILDTSLWELGEFRGYEVQEQGVDGDRERFLILHDFCLISRDEAGSGIVRDVDSTAAMTA